MDIFESHNSLGYMHGADYAKNFPRQRILSKRQKDEYEEYLEGWQEGHTAMQIAIENSFWNQF